MTEDVSEADASFEVVRGSPNSAELAAMRTVLDHALEELAVEKARRTKVRPSAWEQSQRPIRTPAGSRPVSWRGFSG